MTNKLKIVLIPVDSFTNGRGMAEEIENGNFLDMKDIFVHDEEIDRELIKTIEFYDLSDFIDSCNNQEIDLENYWTSYINVME